MSSNSPFAAIDWKSLDGPKLLETLQTVCVQTKISDIHASPDKAGVRLSVRQYGVLSDIAELTHAAYEDLIRRVKFVAKMKLNIVDVPQDGHYTFPMEKKTVAFRVSTIPSRFGEALTVRILDPERGIVPLEKLGFPKAIHEGLADFVQLETGLILITGPTGSGKTTTLYALLNTVVGHGRNIITLEDPIEYELNGVIQSQVDPSHDYDFARGLRAILRQDPDVILVGEIRDTETGQVAVDAALTGHLVLSTLHTNTAIEAVTRLLSMGVSPFTAAPALRAVLNQRLVRTYTDACRTSGTCDPSDPDTYGGVVAVAELLTVSHGIRDLMLQGEAAAALEEQARKEGYRTMHDWAEELVQSGITHPSEVERITR